MKFKLSKTAFEFVTKACSTDGYRPHLTGVCLAEYKRAFWLFATDTHRLHAIKLQTDEHSTCEEFKQILTFSPRRITFEFKYFKGQDFEFEVEEGLFASLSITTYPVDRKRKYRNEDLPKPIAYSILQFPEILQGNYPDLNRIMYDEELEVADRAICVNHKYLLDACLMSKNNSNKVVVAPQPANNGTMVMIKPSKDPHWNHDWFVLLMEMAWQ